MVMIIDISKSPANDENAKYDTIGDDLSMA